MRKQIKLNIGCGETKLKGFINIDLEKKVKPDLRVDIRKSTLPFKDETVSLIQCIHNIEHIEMRYWNIVFSEFQRVLKVGGKLILAYPEFERCAKNFIENKQGKRDFWQATLYGRQLYRGDYHVVPMHTPDFIQKLMKFGFTNIKHAPEVVEDYNTFLTAEKVRIELRTKEDVIRRDLFRK